MLLGLYYIDIERQAGLSEILLLGHLQDEVVALIELPFTFQLNTGRDVEVLMPAGRLIDQIDKVILPVDAKIAGQEPWLFPGNLYGKLIILIEGDLKRHAKSSLSKG